jgi:CheY-like chemotaxis protein
MEFPARYLSSLIERELVDGAPGMGVRVREDSSPLQCVRLLSAEGEPSLIVLGINLSRERTEQALDALRSSQARERLLLYLFSFESLANEEHISQAIMEPELLRMVRDTGIVAYFAMLDARAEMGMLARIDGDMRSIQYLPH